MNASKMLISFILTLMCFVLAFGILVGVAFLINAFIAGDYGNAFSAIIFAFAFICVWAGIYEQINNDV